MKTTDERLFSLVQYIFEMLFFEFLKLPLQESTLRNQTFKILQCLSFKILFLED